MRVSCCIYNIYIHMQLLVILFKVIVLSCSSIGVETHPIWNDEVFQSYPEIRQLHILQLTQRILVRTAIGKLYKTNVNTFVISEDDACVQRRLTDLIKNTNTYLKAEEAAYYIFRVLSKKLDRGMEFHLESETNAFEDVMMQRQNDFKPLKSQIILTLEEFLEAIYGQRNMLNMPEFVPSFDYTVVGKTHGSFLNLMQTDISFVALTDNLLKLIYEELKLKDCISEIEETNNYRNDRDYCI